MEKGDSANRSLSQAVEQLILNLTVPLKPKQPKGHHPWKHSPGIRLFLEQQGVGDLPP